LSRRRLGRRAEQRDGDDQRVHIPYGAHRGVYSRARHLHRVSEDGGGGVTGTVVAGARGAAYCERRSMPQIYPTVHTVGHIESKQHPSQGELPVPLLVQSATMPGVVNGEAGAYRHLRASVECSTRRRFGRHDFPTVALRIPHPPPTMSVGVCTRDQGAAQCRIISNSVAPYQRRELNGGAKVESISSDECV
jgi:hypothetical protein